MRCAAVTLSFGKVSRPLRTMIAIWVSNGLSGSTAALLVLLAGTAGTRIIATDLRAHAYKLFHRGVMMVAMVVVAVITIGSMDVPFVIVIAVRPVHVFERGGNGLGSVGHRARLCGSRWQPAAIALKSTWYCNVT